MIERTVEAIVVAWDCSPSGEGSARAGPALRRIEAACALGVEIAIVSRGGIESLERQVCARPPGPGRLWLCPRGGLEVFRIGPDGARLPVCSHDGSPTDEPARPDATHALERDAQPGSVADLFRAWERQGLTGGLVLFMGAVCDLLDSRSVPMPPCATSGMVAHGTDSVTVSDRVLQVSGGPEILTAVLDEQLHRRGHRRVPAVDENPAWVIRETGIDPLRHRVTETLMTLGAGGFGTRGSVEEGGTGTAPLVLAGDIYRGSGPGQRLLPGPLWTGLEIEPPPTEEVRTLDLRTGVLAREEVRGHHRLRTLRLVSAPSPGVVAMRAEAEVGRLRAGPPLAPPRGELMTNGRIAGRYWARVSGDGAGIGAVATQRSGCDAAVRTVERIASYVAAADHQPALHKALTALEAAEGLGFDRLLAAHRATWAARWEVVNVKIPDDPAAELALRFALFHLWSSVNRHDELGVGARGLSGTGYSGHVFWDADVFVLPAMASIDPAAARAMVRYRLRRLAAARLRARRAGRGGAWFPWESATDGQDVTPTSGLLGGKAVPILTGELEEHVTADVAWAAAHYAAWCDDQPFQARDVVPLLRETARYWASRCRIDSGGSAHIDQVIGPDEYHESVNDNAYTNVMARWNLRAGARLGECDRSDSGESRSWLELADRIVDGYNPSTSRYEQFDGYYRLEPLLIADFARPPVAADVLLGRERVSASQLIKQPDVLMLHHLVPEEVQPESLTPNLDFYGPRTAHGSSLSPAITASLLARAGRTTEALGMLRVALTLDLDDLTGGTAAGLHMATLGGVWQAMITGFGGVRVKHGIVEVDPVLPAAWSRLELRFRCRGSNIRLLATTDTVEVDSSAPVRMRLYGRDPVCVHKPTSAARPAVRMTITS